MSSSALLCRVFLRFRLRLKRGEESETNKPNEEKPEMRGLDTKCLCWCLCWDNVFMVCFYRTVINQNNMKEVNRKVRIGLISQVAIFMRNAVSPIPCRLHAFG